MRVIDGHPVPYALTVEPTAGEGEPTREEVAQCAAEFLATAKLWARVVRTEGRYAYYAPAERWHDGE